MHADVEAIISEIEDEFGCLFSEVAPGRQIALVEGPRTRVELDMRSGLLRVSTPVAGAHDGLGADMLLELLSRNFPNDAIRGSFLAPGGGAGHLALVAALPLQRLDGTTAVRVMLDQIAAALALTEQIATHLARDAAHVA